jgi:hypothetical protein
MAILSNINGKFAVDSTGAVQFSGAAGASGYVLKSNGAGSAPTWVDGSTVIGGPYLPLSGGTLTGSTATASGISFTVGGNLTVQSGNKLILNRPNNAIDCELSTDSSGTLILNSRNSEGFKFQNNGTNFVTGDSSNNVTFAGSVILGTTSNGNAVNKLTIASGTNGDGIFLTGLGTAAGMATGNYKAIDFQYSNTDASFQSAIRFVVVDDTAHGGQIEFFTDNSAGTNTKALTLDKTQNATFTGKILVGTGATAAASLNAFTTTVSANLFSALRVIENTGASSYWDIGATNGASTILNFYHNANTTPKITFTHLGGATFASNVGIGYTLPASILHVGSTGTNAYSTTITKGSNMKGIINTLSNNADDMVGIYFATGTTTEGTHWSGITGSRTDNASHWGTQLNFYTHVNDVAAINDATQKMVIKGDGSVGIGTTTPFGILQLNVDSDHSIMRITAGDSSIAGIDFGKTSDIDDARIRYYNSTRYMEFFVANGERMRITSAGNVGIGTNSPAEKLEVAGSIKSTSRAIAGGSTAGITLSYDTSNSIGLIETWTSKPIGIETAGVRRMTITSGGNVGIGTTSPLEKLNIVETTATAGTFFPVAISGARYQADYGVGIAFRPENNSSAYANKTAIVGSGGGYGYGMADLHFCFNNSTTISDEVSLSDSKVTMKRSGFVGINVTAPSERLEVNTGNIFINGENRGLIVDSVSKRVGFMKYSGHEAYIARVSGQDFGIVRTGGSNIEDGSSLTTDLFISGSGSVGIGKTNPAYQLDVTGSIYCTASYIRASTSPDIWYSNNNTDTYTQTVLYMAQNNTSNNDANGYFLERGRISNSSTAEIRRWVVGARGGQKQMVLDGPGTLTVAGDLVAYGSPSDISLKENIKPIKNPLGKIKKLKGVTFDWKKSESILDIKEDYGFIAQDVQKVIPELVRKNENELLSMRHQGIIPILVEAIKELEARVKELENK